eukprot:scaffold63001_cov75-Phaeocystis_antarctica.AAC.2
MTEYNPAPSPLRSPASERPSDLNRYSPDIHLATKGFGNHVFGNARCHRHSAGRPGWTKTERQGLVDGALGPADDVRDVSTSQTSTAVAARDGAQPTAQQALPADVQLGAG